MNLQQFKGNSIKNILLILFISAVLGFLSYLLLSSVLVSILICLVLFYLLGKQKGGIRVRRVAVDTLLMTKSVTSRNDSSVDYKFGIGFINEINQPLYIGASIDGLYLHYLCYRKKPPLFLRWENINQIEVLNLDEEVSAKVYLSASPVSLIVPWEDSFEKCIPYEFHLIK